MNGLITEKDILHKEYLKILSSVKSKLLCGYDLGLVLYNEAWYAGEKGRRIYKELLKSLLIRPCSFEVNLNGEDILTIATYLNREDHDNYWRDICDDVGNHDNISLFYPKNAKSFICNIDIMGIPTRLNWFIQFFFELKKIKPLRSRIYLALQLIKRKWVLSKVEKLKLAPRIAMCFFDGNPDESLLMLYFKKRGAITVTNQHGQPVFRSADFDRMNQSQILAFKCDYFLAKGKFTKRQLMAAGIDENRIILLGNVGYGYNYHNFNVKENVKGNRVIGLFLDSPTFPFAQELNVQLISITKAVAIKLKCKFFVRIHPLDNISFYSHTIDETCCLGIFDNRTSIRELFSLCDASIIHASAIYLDSYKNSVRAFKYKSDVYFPISNVNDEFETENELFTLLKGWFMEDSKTKKEYINKIYSDYCSVWYPKKTQEILRDLIK